MKILDFTIWKGFWWQNILLVDQNILFLCQNFLLFYQNTRLFLAKGKADGALECRIHLKPMLDKPGREFNEDQVIFIVIEHLHAEDHKQYHCNHCDYQDFRYHVVSCLELVVNMDHRSQLCWLLWRWILRKLSGLIQLWPNTCSILVKLHPVLQTPKSCHCILLP